MGHALLCLALLPPWIWDPVVADCKGGPEPELLYVVTQLQTEPAGFLHKCITDPETGEEVCHDDVVYHPVDVLAEDLVDEPRFPQEAVAVPPLGGVTFIDTEAMDPAENVSGACE